MASLMKKLFDTMPLSGVDGAFYDVPGNPNDATMGHLRRHLRFQRQPAHTEDCPRPSEGFLAKLRGEQSAGITGQWQMVRIWGYDAPADPSRVRRVTCRVRDDKFNNYVVLDQLEWGYAPVAQPKSFRPAVLAVLKGTELELPLSMDFHLMTFTTRGGRNQGGAHWLWPLEAWHDPSIVHVFVYDIQRTTKAIVSLKTPDHPDRAEIDAMLGRCDEINSNDFEDERKAHAYLFQDDLWDTSHTNAPPTGTVPENVDLSLRPIRIVVACSLTLCRERNDFQPGGPVGVGRIYPHVMVIATAPLDRVDAGVRLSRPADTTILDGAHCGCDEMLSQIHGLVVTDSNADAMALNNFPWPVSAPLIYHANLFNYYVPDPISDPNLRDKLIPIVVRSKTVARNDVGSVERDCSDIKAGAFGSKGLVVSEVIANKHRVTKVPRQGAFDNIHLAPRMTVKDKIRMVEVHRGLEQYDIKFKSYQDWKMDAVVMAPFCAHDCFHVHWRWTDNLNNESATYGWGKKRPCEEVGAPMVPENQDVFLLLLQHYSYSYLAQAHDAGADRWQPFFHHGGGYALSAATETQLAKINAALSDEMRFVGDPAGTVTGDWALFYWRLRYRIRPVRKTDAAGNVVVEGQVEERFRFKDEAKALAL